MENKEYAIHPELMKEMYAEAPQDVNPEPKSALIQEVHEEAEPQVEAQQEETVTTQEVKEEPKNSVAMNLRLLREKMEKAERERDEMLELLRQERMAQVKQPKVAAEPQYDDEDIDIPEDDVVEGKHLKNVYKQVKALKQQLKYSEQSNQAIAIEAKIKSQFPDFDRVVTRDNIALLNAMDPILANALNKSPDLYEKAVSTYNVIKKFNINNYDKYEAEETKIKQNTSKPRSTSSISPQQASSPLARANIFAQGLTKDVKEQLVKEMEEAIRNRNNF